MTIKTHLATLAHYPSLLVSSTARTALMEIERLEAENARLREALREIETSPTTLDAGYEIRKRQWAARAALKETEE
jgi:hypothetical protein